MQPANAHVTIITGVQCLPNHWDMRLFLSTAHSACLSSNHWHKRKPDQCYCPVVYLTIYAAKWWLLLAAAAAKPRMIISQTECLHRHW